MARRTDAEKAVFVAMVCQSMSDGMTGRKACAQHGIQLSDILRWCDENPEYEKQYQHARRLLLAHWAEEIIEISDETQTGVIRRDTPQGMTIESRDMLEHRKLRVQSRQWMLGKLSPTFGEKMQLGGAPDLPPIGIKADITLSPEDAYKKMIGGGDKT